MDTLYQSRRAENQAALEKRRDMAYSAFPQLAELEHQQVELLSRMGSLIAAGRGEQAKQVVLQAQQLAQRRLDLLQEQGMPQNYLSLQPQCPLCSDTGFVEGLPCSCYEKTLRQLSYEQSPLGRALRDQTFDNFSLAHYPDVPDAAGRSPRKLMAHNLRRAQSFVREFGTERKNLLLMGPSGLGKTHLSSAIGGELAALGYHVVYKTAPALFAVLEAERFGRGDGEGATYAECDLLMIDDLGSELITPLVQSLLFAVLNTRLIEDKRVLLSTNYTLRELDEHYTQKIFSRVIGSFEPLHFAGADIRQIMAQRG